MGGGVSVERNEREAKRSTQAPPKSPSKSSSPMYEVSLQSVEGFEFSEPLPPRFILRINYESLDFVNVGSLTPLFQFPFQHIICWGSSVSNFRFHVYDFTSPGSPKKSPNGGDICIILRTTEGKTIEENTMRIVRLLMADMDKKAVSKDEFAILLSKIVDSSGTQLEPDWLQMVDQFSTNRVFLAKQCMDLMLLVGPLAPFEKLDFACFLYTRILSADSFQLVVNTFDDQLERGNLIHRLGLKSSDLVTNCSILPGQAIVSPITVVGEVSGEARSPKSKSPTAKSASSTPTSKTITATRSISSSDFGLAPPRQGSSLAAAPASVEETVAKDAKSADL